MVPKRVEKHGLVGSGDCGDVKRNDAKMGEEK